MNVQSTRDEVKLGEAGSSYRVLIPLDAAPLEAGSVGELVLGEAALVAECGDAVADFYLAGVDPVGDGGTAAGHSTNALTRQIMWQYPSGRLLDRYR